MKLPAGMICAFVGSRSNEIGPPVVFTCCCWPALFATASPRPPIALPNAERLLMPIWMPQSGVSLAAQIADQIVAELKPDTRAIADGLVLTSSPMVSNRPM